MTPLLPRTGLLCFWSMGFLAGGTASEASVAVGVRPRAVFFCESFGGRPRKLVGRFEGGDGTVGQ